MGLPEEGKAIAERLGNGVGYYGPWLPYGPEGEFMGHFFRDDAVTKSSFVAKTYEEAKQELINIRERFGAQPPVFSENPGRYGGREKGGELGKMECKKEKPTRRELTRFALKLVASMRGHSTGVVEVSQLKDWTKEEIEGTANLLLEDLREGRTEELERLYLETCGEPFKEEYIAG